MSHLEIALLALVFVLAFAVVWLLKPRRRRGGMIDLTAVVPIRKKDELFVFDWDDPRHRDTIRKPVAPPLDPSNRSR